MISSKPESGPRLLSRQLAQEGLLDERPVLERLRGNTPHRSQVFDKSSTEFLAFPKEDDEPNSSP